MPGPNQLSLFEPTQLSMVEATPAAAWELDTTKRALDELFSLTYQYRTSAAYKDLIQFVSRFRFYSPFNAMLIHIQMPGGTFIQKKPRKKPESVGLPGVPNGGSRKALRR